MNIFPLNIFQDMFYLKICLQNNISQAVFGKG